MRKYRETLVKLRISAFQKEYLRIREFGIVLEVDFPVKASQQIIKLRASALRKLAVKHDLFLRKLLGISLAEVQKVQLCRELLRGRMLIFWRFFLDFFGKNRVFLAKKEQF